MALMVESRYSYLNRLKFFKDCMNRTKSFFGLVQCSTIKKILLEDKEDAIITILAGTGLCYEINCHEKHYIGWQESPKEEMYYLQHKERTRND